MLTRLSFTPRIVHVISLQVERFITGTIDKFLYAFRIIPGIGPEVSTRSP